MASTYASQGRFEVAEVKLKKAIDEDDSIAQAHSGLGYVYWQRGDIEDAQTEFRRAISLDDIDPEIRNNYGAFLCDQHKYEEGDRNFMLALKNRDYATPAKAWNNAAVCARQAGDSGRAETDFRRALQSDPNYYPALAEMASFSYQQQNYLGARAFLERYQKAGPETPAMLLLGFKTEQALGNDDAAHQYSLKLIRSYPDSDEAAQLLKLRAMPLNDSTIRYDRSDGGTPSLRTRQPQDSSRQGPGRLIRLARERASHRHLGTGPADQAGAIHAGGAGARRFHRAERSRSTCVATTANAPRRWRCRSRNCLRPMRGWWRRGRRWPRPSCCFVAATPAAA